MTTIERTAYPRFRSTYTEQELNEFYTLSEAELQFAAQSARTKTQQMALALGEVLSDAGVFTSTQ